MDIRFARVIVLCMMVLKTCWHTKEEVRVRYPFVGFLLIIMSNEFSLRQLII